ncbi:MAG: hypothetical protein EYC70_02810 [Planctomycetota bacterium]|nr:MAG: hypothetical protein EYC70_02810 [Planctomycetota bacterium]
MPGARSNNQAQGAGDGDFVINLDRWLPPAGPVMYGVVDPGITPAAVQFYGELSPAGGLQRATRRMDILANQAYRAAELVAFAHSNGLRSLLTCVGTPRDNASGDPPTEEWHTLPGYARTPPLDMQAWADDLVAMLTEMQSRYALLPDYVEVWNEPEREEWWTGTREQYLDLYRITSVALKSAFPQVRVGGPGLASSESTLDGPNTLLEAMVVQAGELGNPLDFLSWHDYGAGGEIRYRSAVEELRALAQASGLNPAPELFVTEWNIYPNGGDDNPNAIELDGPHAAAKVAGFLASAHKVGLDGHCFFMLQDAEEAQFEVLDLTGASTGAFTHRGVKKPAFRLMEFLYPMAQQSTLVLQYPANEWAVSAFGALLPDGGLRLVVANDVVDEAWVWTNGCRERGAEPGVLWNAVELLNDMRLPITHVNLVNVAGLEPWEADVVLAVQPLAEEAQWIARHPRTVRFQTLGGALVPVQAWRFDPTHNAPAARRDEILPEVEAAEVTAQHSAWDAIAAFFAGHGVKLPDPWNIEEWPGSPEELAEVLGITLSLAEEAWELFYETLEAQRLARRAELNDLPATRLVGETPEAALVLRNSDFIEITLLPNSVTVVDLHVLLY